MSATTNYSKFTFVSATFASIKDDSSLIHVVPTIAEFEKNWNIRPIVHPFQFARRWYDMVEEEEDDEEFIDPNGSEYYESFLVGSIPSNEVVAIESNTPSNDVVDAKSNIPSNELEVTSNTTQEVRETLDRDFEHQIEISSSTKKQNTIVGVFEYLNEKQPKPTFETNNIANNNLYNFEVFSEFAEASHINDSSNVSINYTSEFIGKIYSDLNIEKDTSLNKLNEMLKNKIIAKNQLNIDTSKNHIANFNENSHTSILLLTLENSKSKTISLSLKQNNQIPENFDKINTKDYFVETSLTLPKRSFFLQYETGEFFKLSLLNILDLTENNNRKYQDIKMINWNEKYVKNIEKVNGIEKLDYLKSLNKPNEKMVGINTSANEKSKKFSITSENKDWMPIEFTNTNPIKTLCKLSCCETNNNSLNDIINYTPLLTYIDQLIPNNSLDTLIIISETSELGETFIFLNIDGVVVKNLKKNNQLFLYINSHKKNTFRIVIKSNFQETLKIIFYSENKNMLWDKVKDYSKNLMKICIDTNIKYFKNENLDILNNILLEKKNLRMKGENLDFACDFNLDSNNYQEYKIILNKSDSKVLKTKSERCIDFDTRLIRSNSSVDNGIRESEFFWNLALKGKTNDNFLGGYHFNNYTNSSYTLSKSIDIFPVSLESIEFYYSDKFEMRSYFPTVIFNLNDKLIVQPDSAISKKFYSDAENTKWIWNYKGIDFQNNLNNKVVNIQSLNTNFKSNYIYDQVNVYLCLLCSKLRQIYHNTLVFLWKLYCYLLFYVFKGLIIIQ